MEKKIEVEREQNLKSENQNQGKKRYKEILDSIYSITNNVVPE